MAAKKKTKKKAGKKKAAKKSAARDTLCVGSKVKAYIKSNGMKCSGELIQALSTAVCLESFALDREWLSRSSGHDEKKAS